MRKNAILRIVLYSLVILLLTGILLTGLGIGAFSFSLGLSSQEYMEGSGAADAQMIRRIQIQWASGNIRLETEDTEDICFSESGSGDPMVYEILGDTLIIRYSKPTISIGFISYAKKDLTVTVPYDWVCEDLELEVASADISINNWTIDQSSLDTASGECVFFDCNVNTLNIDTASGSIRYIGSLNTLDCNAASANFTGSFTNIPKSLEMDSASGDLDITLPENAGFRVTLDALSGKFHSDFPATQNGNSYFYGDEACIIDFDGASGNVRIRKVN